MAATVTIRRWTGSTGSPTKTDITSINTRANAEDAHSTDVYTFGNRGKKHVLINGEWVAATVYTLNSGIWVESTVLYYDGNSWIETYVQS